MKALMLCIALLLAVSGTAPGSVIPTNGVASWYGEEHRGKLMANGKKFDPDKLTAASWFYPLGSKVRVSLNSSAARSVVVTITDRGPGHRLVRDGRIIDLAHAAFQKLATPKAGLVPVVVELVSDQKVNLARLEPKPGLNGTNSLPVAILAVCETPGRTQAIVGP